MKKNKIIGKKAGGITIVLVIISIMITTLSLSGCYQLQTEAPASPEFEATFIVKNADGKPISKAIIGMGLSVSYGPPNWEPEYTSGINRGDPIPEHRVLYVDENKWYIAMHSYETDSNGVSQFRYGAYPSSGGEYLFFVKKEGYKPIVDAFDAKENDDITVNVKLELSSSGQQPEVTVSNSTPGFELGLFIVSILSIAFILNHKKKREG